MPDFEERLRATVLGRSEAYEPSAELPDHIHGRVRHHRRRRQLVAGGLVAAALAVVVMAGVERGDEGSVRMADANGPFTTDRRDTTSTSTPPSSGTAEAASSTTSTTDRRSSTGVTSSPPTGSDFDALTPMTRSGIGPITLGMTLRRAQEASGVTITPLDATSDGCVEASIEALGPDARLVVEVAPGGDPLDGTVRAVADVVGSTEEGVVVGQTRADVVAILGEPTRSHDQSATWGGPADMLVFESGGHAYGVLVVDDVVFALQTGEAAWVDGANGCPT